MDMISTIVHDQALQQILLLALIAMVADVVVNILRALREKDPETGRMLFSLQYVAEFLGSHVLQRVGPIAALAILGASLSATISPTDANVPLTLTGLSMGAWGAAWAALAAYLLETYNSLRTPPLSG